MTLYYSIITTGLGLVWLLAGGGMFALALLCGGLLASGGLFMRDVLAILRGR